MERTARLVVLLEPAALKNLKVYAAQNGLSMGELARRALEERYGTALSGQHFTAPKVSEKANKR